ncbi:MAG: flagellar biosynthetic protein FliR [Gammaproteobacteria bacterium]|nr:flagellar biosynthetic protein FliR [Gammaproteobacteria bacterium]
MFNAAELLDFWAQFLWPFTRVAAVAMVAPMIGSRFVQPRVRLLFAAAVTLVLLPVLPPMPDFELFGAAWFLTLAQQVLVGMAIGFALQLVFEAVVLGSDLISLGVGLSFAQLIDPLRGVDAPVVAQFFVIVATLLFVSLNGHHLILEALAESFRTLPVGARPDPGGAWAMVAFGSQVFAGGMAIALPAVTALLIVNLSFGIVSRAAPTLNLFAIGFPLTLVFGMFILQLTLPSLQKVLTDLLDGAWLLIARMVGG